MRRTFTPIKQIWFEKARDFPLSLSRVWEVQCSRGADREWLFQWLLCPLGNQLWLLTMSYYWRVYTGSTQNISSILSYESFKADLFLRNLSIVSWACAALRVFQVLLNSASGFSKLALHSMSLLETPHLCMQDEYHSPSLQSCAGFLGTAQYRGNKRAYWGSEQEGGTNVVKIIFLLFWSLHNSLPHLLKCKTTFKSTFEASFYLGKVKTDWCNHF